MKLVTILLVLIACATSYLLWTSHLNPPCTHSALQPVLLTSQPVQRVVITNRNKLNPLSILEIKAYDEDHNVIVSVPTSSSVRDNDMLQYGPQYVIDSHGGNLGRGAETRQDSVPEWIQINLKREYVLSKLEVYNRLDCCQDELIGSEILLLNANRDVVQTLVVDSARKVYVFTQ